MEEYWQKFKNLFQPKERVESIYKIDLKALAGRGINSLIIDIDDTLIPKTTNDIPLDTFEWVVSRREEGFKICLTSNSRHPMRVKAIGQSLSLPYSALSFKPLPFAFWRALKLMNANPSQAAVVGDQLFMDIVGGNLVGAHTIFVEPMTEETFWPRKVMRWAEGLILRPSAPALYHSV